MAMQGKCERCKIYFSWKKNVLFKKLCCPYCAPSKNIQLQRTTSQLGTGKTSKYIWRHLNNAPLKENYLSRFRRWKKEKENKDFV